MPPLIWEVPPLIWEVPLLIWEVPPLIWCKLRIKPISPTEVELGLSLAKGAIGLLISFVRARTFLPFPLQAIIPKIDCVSKHFSSLLNER